MTIWAFNIGMLFGALIGALTVYTIHIAKARGRNTETLYRHFKGNIYKVIANAVHTETGEVLVIYTRNDGTDGIWARRYKEFHGMHESGVKRFVTLTNTNK